MLGRPNFLCSTINSSHLIYGCQNTILSLKNSSPSYDEFHALIENQCIDNYVIPLTYVINMSLMEGIFPSELKLAKVVPIFKSGESDEVLNYRQISVLSFFSKIFEKIMYNNVVNFMDKNDTLYKYQFWVQEEPLHTACYYNTCGQNYIILGFWRSYNRSVSRFEKKHLTLSITTYY